MQLEQAMAGLKHGDTSLARNLIRKLTISSRPSVMTNEQMRRPRKAILDTSKQVRNVQASPSAQDLYFVSYVHRFHQNRMEIKEENRMNRKKMVLLEIKGDLKRYFHLSHPIAKTDYKAQLERYMAQKKAKA